MNKFVRILTNLWKFGSGFELNSKRRKLFPAAAEFVSSTG